MFDLKHLENKLRQDGYKEKDIFTTLKKAKMIARTDKDTFVFLTLAYSKDQTQKILTEAVKGNLFLYILDEIENVFYCLRPGEINRMKRAFPEAVLIKLPNRTQQPAGLCDVFVSKNEADTLLNSRLPPPDIDDLDFSEGNTPQTEKESVRDRNDRMRMTAAQWRLDNSNISITEIQKRLYQAEQGKSNITRSILRKEISNRKIKETMKYLNSNATKRF